MVTNNETVFQRLGDSKMTRLEVIFAVVCLIAGISALYANPTPGPTC